MYFLFPVSHRSGQGSCLSRSATPPRYLTLQLKISHLHKPWQNEEKLPLQYQHQNQWRLFWEFVLSSQFLSSRQAPVWALVCHVWKLPSVAISCLRVAMERGPSLKKYYLYCSPWRAFSHVHAYCLPVASVLYSQPPCCPVLPGELGAPGNWGSFQRSQINIPGPCSSIGTPWKVACLPCL